MPNPTPKQALNAAKALAASRDLGVHPRCTPDLRLLGIEPEEAVELVAAATMSHIVKSEPDNDPARPFWALELSMKLSASRPELLYVKVMLHLPTDLRSGFILSFKPSTD